MHSATYVQNRVRNAVSFARAGLIDKIEQPDAYYPLFDIFFVNPIVPSQIEMVNGTALKVIDSKTHLMTVKAPADWLPKPEVDFEPLVITPRPVNQHLIALTGVCSVCQCQYEAIYTKTFFEQNPSDAYNMGIYRKRCPVCEKIERPKQQVVAVRPLPSIVVIPAVIVAPPGEQLDSLDELVAAARGVLEWYRMLPYSYVGAPHRRLANALVPFEQQPAGLELVK